MSLRDMLYAIKLPRYKDSIMNYYACIKIHNMIKEYEFLDEIKILSEYYEVSPLFIEYFNDPCPDNPYMDINEIIVQSANYTNSQDFCIHSKHWIGKEDEALEIFSKFKTIHLPDFTFNSTRELWKTRSLKDLIFNLF